MDLSPHETRRNHRLAQGELLEETHKEMIQLVQSFTQEELFDKGFYKCTYTTTMAAYFASVTTSPYGQAVKLLKTHLKNLKDK